MSKKQTFPTLQETRKLIHCKKRRKNKTRMARIDKFLTLSYHFLPLMSANVKYALFQSEIALLRDRACGTRRRMYRTKILKT